MKHDDILQKLNISKSDYKAILKKLKREPNLLELSLFSAMWSEHCGYRHSKKLLSELYKDGIVYSGENAGGVKIGGHVVLFKMESHNHPSAIDPYNGSATGVGGIIRDVLTMGARPIALADCLFFGDINEKSNRHIIDGVTRGISDYGNNIGVPTLCGLTLFDEKYNKNPLVNVMALGVVKSNRVVTSKAQPGKLILLVGNPTMRDGIGGASFASKTLEDDVFEDKLSVQIADPFTKKRLIEATLEIFSKGLVLSAQDCGAAGILSSTCEIGYKSKCGIELQLEKIHTAELLMRDDELMLSETQERMIFIVDENAVNKIKKVCKKYELEYSLIGKTIVGKDYTLLNRGETVAKLPINFLINAPIKNTLTKKTPQKPRRGYSYRAGINLKEKIYSYIQNPNFASKEWIYSQYDYSVGNRTAMVPSDKGLSIIHLREENCYLGISVGAKPYPASINPYLGTVNSFLNCYRKIVAKGFEPLAYTNCQNFSNPEKPEIMAQFVECIRGMNDAAEELKVPVASGNVSFYNENQGVDIFPTSVFTMIGTGKKLQTNNYFKNNEILFLLGKSVDEKSEIGGSQYFKCVYNELGNALETPDFKQELRLKKLILELINNELISSCQSVGTGGLFATVFKGLVPKDLGFKGSLAFIEDNEKAFFGEVPAQYVISTGKKGELLKFLTGKKCDFKELGKTTLKPEIAINSVVLNKEIAFDLYKNSLEKMIENS